MSSIQVSKIEFQDPNIYAVILDNVFTADECRTLIERSESGPGYEAALLNIGNGKQVLATSIRNSQRRIIDDFDLAGTFWSRIQSYVPNNWIGRPVVGLNERLRFLRYDPGEEFKPHFDGQYTRDDGSESSYITVQIYLNKVEKGGETILFGSRNGLKEDLPVVPKIGRVLIFQHSLVLHSGAPVVQGRKYTIRTDVMFKNNKY
ncbi:hypothetical protein HDU97_002664 [Phlyctochytrium planicorne]|nr:hypothetical protein HDU97_002664 [Phlyctochytrium planicorne]